MAFPLPLLRPARIRWWIFSFTLAFPMLSYIQRLSVQDLANSIMPALHLSQLQIAWLATAFTSAYAIAQFPGGLFAQRVGARWSLVAVGVVGCCATLAFPVATVMFSGVALFAVLLIAQSLLGISQGPLFPAATAIIESWLPANRWAMAGGLQCAFMNIGGAITPLLVILLSSSLGWRGALVSVAVPVAGVSALWAWYGRDRPRDHPDVGPGELAELGTSAAEADQPLAARRLFKLLSDRNVLLLSLAYLCMNYLYYLLSFWSFLYLLQVRHFSGIEGGVVGAVPWIGAGLGAAVGGFISDRLAISFGARWGMRVVPLVALPVAGVLLLICVHVPTPSAAVVALFASFFMVEITEGAFGAAIISVARSDVAAAFGVLNTGGNIAGIIAHPIVGLLTSRGEWDGAFITGTLFSLAAAGIWLAIDAERLAVLE